MPFFSNKFSPAKTVPRKKLSFHRESQGKVVANDPIKLVLGGDEWIFLKGEWVPGSGQKGQLYKEHEQLKEYSQELKEQNNLLHLKTEILFDMLTKTTYESMLKDKEIKRLQNELMNKK